MKHKIYFLSLLLFSSISLHATVYNGTCGANLTWTLDTSTRELVISGTGIMTDFTQGGQSRAPWWERWSSITSVVINNGVTTIGNNAFYACYGVSSVNLPNSVTQIGKNAFDNCQALSAITIPNSVTTIGEHAFSFCKFTSLIIPSNVISIGVGAFSGCKDITSIIVEQGNSSYDSRNGCNAIVETSTNTLIAGCCNTMIPNDVTSINDEAFYYCSTLTSITIPNGVTQIGKYAFENCMGLTSILIPNSVTTIENGAFSNCFDLSSITLGNGVTTIGISAFAGCSGFTTITIPSSVTSIGAQAFGGCSKLTSISIPYGISSIEDNTFSYCTNLTSVIIPNTVTSIGESAFKGCSNLSNINIPDNVISIGDFAFYNCSNIKSITIPQNVTSYGSQILYGCSGLTTIICKILTPPELSSSLDFYLVNKSIPLYVPTESFELYQSALYWSDFTDIRGMIIASGSCGPNAVWTLDIDGLLTISGTGNMYNWASSEDEYPSWSNYSDQITSVIIKDGVTSIGDEAFYLCNNLTTISIPNSVTSIGYLAFYGCSNLSSITLPYGITQIESHTFSGCSGLSSITIPSSVTTIKDYAFLRCSGLSSITIPNSVTSIWNNAFFGCSGLSSITIPNSVTSIGNNAFFGCSGLASISVQTGNPKYDSRDNCNAIIETATNKLFVGCKNTTISNTITSIASDAFTDCSGLSSITIPNSVTSIGNYAFSGCSGLTSITIPNSVTIIGRQAFFQCSSLASIEIGPSVTSVGTDVFRNCTKLKTVTCYAIAPPTAGYSDFYGLPYNSVLYVLNESLSSYAAATGWSSFGNRIRPITKTANIGFTGWTTFSCDEPLDFANMTASTGDAAAYYASSATGSVVTLTETDAVVAAGEGFLLKGEEGATITIPVASSGTTISGNKLVGCPSGATITSATPNYANIYVLANNNGTAQFENIKDYVDNHTSLSLGAGKAYLNLAGISLAPDALRFELEENNATQLESLAENENVVKFFQNGQLYILRDGITYDTMGRIVR